MSDTPRTDARVRMMIDNDISPEGLEYFARDLERELTDARRTIESMRAENLAVKVAGRYAIDYIDGKHRDAGRVFDGWRKANK